MFADAPAPWQQAIGAVTQRFNREYSGETLTLPPEVESMPIFQDWVTGQLTSRVATPFWELGTPKKQQRCLDLGCGISFLIYPWRDWQATFTGQDISPVAQKILNSRGPQLNSKLFKGVQLAPAHRLEYPDHSFDWVIATGFSCYFPLDYWDQVLSAVKRVLKPGGCLIFDVADPDQALTENWSILELYLGAEVMLEPLSVWQSLIKASGGRVMGQRPGEVFHGFRVKY